MLAAEEGALLLEPVAENADAALVACRGQRVNGALETVGGMGDPAHAQLERLVVIGPAGFTSGHDDLAAVLSSFRLTTRAAPRQFRLARVIGGFGLASSGRRERTRAKAVAARSSVSVVDRCPKPFRH